MATPVANSLAPAPASPSARGVGTASPGNPLLALVMLFSLMVPVFVDIGSFNLLPHRFYLLIFIIPMTIQLFSGKAGRVLIADWLVLFVAYWSTQAYLMNGSFERVYQIAGSQFLEYWGGYVVGRVCIRSPQDLQKIIRVLFVTALCLAPLAAIESFSHRAIVFEFLGRVPANDVRLGLRRAQTVFAHPILYGTFIVALLGMVWYAYQPAASLMKRILFAFLIFATSFFALSAGPLLAYIIQAGSIGYEMMMKKNPRRWTFLIVGTVTGYIALDMITAGNPIIVLIAILTFNPESSYTRVLIFEHGMNNVYANPVFGLGQRRWERLWYMTASIDNWWLSTAMWFGVPAFAAQAFTFFWAIRRWSMVNLEGPLANACRAGLLTSLTGIVVVGVTVHYWNTMLVYVMFLVGSGMWMLAPPRGQSPIQPTVAQVADEPADSEKPKFVPYGREA